MDGTDLIALPRLEEDSLLQLQKLLLFLKLLLLEFRELFQEHREMLHRLPSLLQLLGDGFRIAEQLREAQEILAQEIQSLDRCLGSDVCGGRMVVWFRRMLLRMDRGG